MTEDDRGAFDKLTAGLDASPEAQETAEALEQQRHYQEFLGKLHAEALGRAIVQVKRGNASAAVTQTDAGLRLEHTEAPKETELIGYILPLSQSENLDDPQHLVLMKDGQMLAIKPQPSANNIMSQVKKEQYAEYFNHNTSAFEVDVDAQSMTRRFRNSVNGLGLHIVYDSADESSQGHFPKLLGNALTEARSLQENRLAAKRARISGANQMLGEFFKSSPTNEPPPAAPPSGKP